MKSAKYLEKLQEEKRLNNTELAKLLGLTQPAISQYKSGKRVMDEETCLAIAMALEIEPLQIIAAAGIDRAERSGQHSLWEVFMSRMAATASALLFVLFVNFILTPQAANAATAQLSAEQINPAINYAKFRAWYC
ncbi:helix-turn-helix domain-containing protein [Undibacterium sp. Tian12W]|uniref:helix-turn-helix domain-containing protein n=1 Tax=Undibacterium sp. Tian12W TaxID=3413054 RepID=UPI003BF161ED